MVGKGRFFVGGNWKCNETMAEVKHLVEELNAGSVPDDIEIIVAPTYIHLQMVRGISGNKFAGPCVMGLPTGMQPGAASPKASAGGHASARIPLVHLIRLQRACQLGINMADRSVFLGSCRSRTR